MVEQIDGFEERKGDSFLFLKNERITVGEHGDNDFTFADGEPVYDKDDSTAVFEAGNGISGDLGLNEYVFQDGVTVEANENPPVFEGERSLKLDRSDLDAPGRITSFPGDGLPNYPSAGDTVKVDMEIVNSGIGGSVRMVASVGVQSTDFGEGAYTFFTSLQDQEFTFRVWSNGNSDDKSVSFSHSSGTKYTLTIDWGSGGNITASIGGASVTRTNSQYTEGGVSWGVGQQNDDGLDAKVAFDDARIV